MVRRVTTSGTTSDNKWQRVAQLVTTNDNEWQRVVQRMATNDIDWQWVKKSGNEWQWMSESTGTASESIGKANENGTIDFKEWMIAIIWMTKEIHYYFKGWMAAIRAVK